MIYMEINDLDEKTVESNLFVKKCKWCNAEFESLVSRQLFCSDDCNEKYNNVKIRQNHTWINSMSRLESNFSKQLNGLESYFGIDPKLDNLFLDQIKKHTCGKTNITTRW